MFRVLGFTVLGFRALKLPFRLLLLCFLLAVLYRNIKMVVLFDPTNEALSL